MPKKKGRELADTGVGVGSGQTGRAHTYLGVEEGGLVGVSAGRQGVVVVVSGGYRPRVQELLVGGLGSVGGVGGGVAGLGRRLHRRLRV